MQISNLCFTLSRESECDLAARGAVPDPVNTHNRFDAMSIRILSKPQLLTGHQIQTEDGAKPWREERHEQSNADANITPITPLFEVLRGACKSNQRDVDVDWLTNRRRERRSV